MGKFRPDPTDPVASAKGLQRRQRRNAAPEFNKDEDEDLDDFICPECGSCGEEGCCPPDQCKTVHGLYCEKNLQSYKALEEQWDIMYKALVHIASLDSGVMGIAQKAVEDVDDAMKMEH